MFVPSSLWLALDYFTYFFSYGIFLPYWGAWLKGEGHDVATVGMLLSVGLVARFVGSLFITPLFKDPSRLIFALRLMALCSFLFAVAFYFGSHWLWLFFVMAGFNLFFSPMIPLGDSLAATWQKQFPMDYGSIRVWGSVAFIIATSVTGMLMDIWKHEVILAALVVSTGSLLLTSLLRPRIMPSGEMKQRGPQVKFRVLLKDNAVVRFLLCVSLLQGAHAAYYGFSVIYWQKVGYSDAAIGYLWSLGVVAEVIVFTFSNKLFRRWSAANLLLLSGICGILRWSLLGMSAALPVLIVAQILHSGSYTVCHLAAMRFIGARKSTEIIPLQAAYSALAMGGAIAVMTLVAGYLYEDIHGGIFYLMALTVLPALFLRPKVRPQTPENA